MRFLLTCLSSMFLCLGLAQAQVRQAWVTRYEGVQGGSSSGGGEANAMTTDRDGNVYVVGNSPGWGWDFATVKYDPQGHQLWVARYNGSPDRNFNYDYGRAIAVDESGNVYVTGESCGTLGDPFGSWNPQTDFVTIKYDRNGHQLWATRFDGGQNETSDAPVALAVDAAGNVYVTGQSRGKFCTIKYDSDGRQQWLRFYSGSWAAGGCAARAIVVDSAGAAYVTGYSSLRVGGSGATDYATIKYDTHGNEVWVARYRPPGDGWADPVALQLDSLGDVYVAGTVVGRHGNDIATVKYDPSGQEMWSRVFDGPAHLDDAAVSLQLDRQGNVLVGGTATGLFHRQAIAVVKYDSDGNQAWATLYDGPTGDRSFARCMALDAAGNAYLAGFEPVENSSYGDEFYVTVKINSDGREAWMMRYHGPNTFNNYASAITVDASGTVYVTGTSRRLIYEDYTTIKYTQTGG